MSLVRILIGAGLGYAAYYIYQQERKWEALKYATPDIILSEEAPPPTMPRPAAVQSPPVDLSGSAVQPTPPPVRRPQHVPAAALW
jgi:hypothetical protein